MRKHRIKTPKRLYDQVAWLKASKKFLSEPENLLCASCLSIGRERASELTDHIIPHNDDPEKFWDRSNWSPLCLPCHGRKRRQENTGIVEGADIDGIPTDPNHPWNK